jgi:hypothetical protein
MGMESTGREGASGIRVVFVQNCVGVLHVDVLRACPPGVGLIVLCKLVIVSRLV